MNTKRVIQNAKWIVGCKVIQALLNLIVGMLSARYLGPTNYGLINYASSVVGVFVPIMQLGMRSTLVHEYISRPEEEGKVLGTSMVMTLVSSLVCMISVATFTSALNPRDYTTILVVLLYSLLLPFQAIEMIQYWFQAKLLSKYPSLAMLGAYAIVSAYKIFLLVSKRSVYWFAISHAFEAMISGTMLILIFSKKTNLKLSVSWSLVKELFARSKYYIISAMMVTIFANTDHIMLTLMIGKAENGIYSASITSAGVFNFVYAAIIDSARPEILSSKQNDKVAYENSVSGLYSIIIYLALTQSLCMSFLSKPILLILYGEAYLSAVPVLQISAWIVAFSYIGTVRNVWILAEGKHSLLWVINLLGALLNIAINAVLIPAYGACGAAGATVATQIFTNVVTGFIFKPIRPNNKLLIKGLSIRFAKKVICGFVYPQKR